MNKLQSIIREYEEQGNTVPTSLKEMINKPKEIKSSINKKVSMMGATEARQKKVTNKIKMALEYIAKEKKKMTFTAIAKYAEVSPITVKKYVISIENNEAVTSKDFYYLTLK